MLYILSIAIDTPTFPHVGEPPVILTRHLGRLYLHATDPDLARLEARRLVRHIEGGRLVALTPLSELLDVEQQIAGGE